MAIAALKLANIDDVPSYIKVKQTLYTVDDFLLYASKFGGYGSFFSDKRYAQLCEMDNGELITYVDWGLAND
jgi:hypothetical protein